MPGPDHRHDIAAPALDAMAALSPRPQTLRRVVEASREILGFFPAHNPRALEYPWLIDQLADPLQGTRILDVGAGVNALPFLLARRGATVVTLDNHPLTRDPRARADWNEWGFLDYALIDPRVRSVRCAYEAWDSPLAFDCIYSISVIEHVARDVRLAWIDNFRRQLAPGGLLLLTVDLVRDTDQLWNLCEGKPVEDPAVHGGLATLLDELRDAGLAVETVEVQRGIPDCRVDIGFIRARSARAAGRGVRAWLQSLFRRAGG